MAKSKYHAIRTTLDGITFDSKREAARYRDLKILEKIGEIWDLELQPKFPLVVASTSGYVAGACREPQRIGEYQADFKYHDKTRVPYVVEDVKGMKTPLYKWKKRHVEAQYGITVTEI